MDICITASRVAHRYEEVGHRQSPESVALELAWQDPAIARRSDLWRTDEMFRPGAYPLAPDCWVIRFVEIPAVPAQQIERREITVTATVVRNAMMERFHSRRSGLITDGDINQCIDRIALEAFTAGEWRVVDRRRSGDGALVTIERIPTPPEALSLANRPTGVLIRRMDVQPILDSSDRGETARQVAVRLAWLHPAIRERYDLWTLISTEESSDGLAWHCRFMPIETRQSVIRVDGVVDERGGLQGPIVVLSRAPAQGSRIQVDLGDGTSHWFTGNGRSDSFRLPTPRREELIQGIAETFQIPREMLSDGATDVMAMVQAEIDVEIAQELFRPDPPSIMTDASETNDNGAFSSEGIDMSERTLVNDLPRLASIEVFLNGIALNRGQYIINARCHSVTLDFVPEAENMLMIRHSGGETNHRTDGTENEFGFPFFQYPPEESQPPTIRTDIQVNRGGATARLRWDETRFISRISDDFYGQYWEFFKKEEHLSEDVWVDMLMRVAGVPIEILKRDHDGRCTEIQWRPRRNLSAMTPKPPQLKTTRRRREQTDILSEEVSEE